MWDLYLMVHHSLFTRHCPYLSYLSWAIPGVSHQENRRLKQVEDAEDEDFPAANIDGDLSGKNQLLNQQKLGILKTILKVSQSIPFKV